MRTLNVVFEDKEYKALENKKGKRNWRQFLLDEILGEKDHRI